MRGQAGFFDLDELLKALLAKGDTLERLGAVVDFELFRAALVCAVPPSSAPCRAWMARRAGARPLTWC